MAELIASGTENVNVFAVWAPIEGRLNITFLDSMDSEYSWTWNGAPASDWYFDPTTSGAMNHPGYAFAGWSYSPDGLLEEDYTSGAVSGQALAASGNRLYLPGTDQDVYYFRF